MTISVSLVAQVGLPTLTNFGVLRPIYALRRPEKTNGTHCTLYAEQQLLYDIFVLERTI